jgi:hypothetical protein
MDITVEIGTEEQQRAIRDEVSVLQHILNQIGLTDLICAVWIPNDFDAKVNQLQMSSDYTAERGHLAIAKHVINDRGHHLIFSQVLFMEGQDIYTRMQTYFHELFHVFYSDKFSPFPKTPMSNAIYYQAIYTLFDEYAVNRTSLRLVKNLCPEISMLYRQSLRSQVHGHLCDVINPRYYQLLRNELADYRTRRDYMSFAKQTRNCIDEVMKSLVYFFSIIDETPNLKRFEPFLARSHFYVDSAVALINHFRDKHNAADFDLSDGLELMKEYIKLFGFYFEEDDHGTRCVLL